MDEKVVLAIAQNKAAEAGSVTQEKVTEAVSDYITDNPSALNQSAVEAIVGDRIDDIVLVQNTQPTEEDNKIWVPNGEIAETQVPTYEEFSQLKNSLDTATDSDIGKALSPKTVASGHVTEWQFKSIGGGGAGGTSDYSELENKPQINGVTLTGNKSLADLGVASASDVAGKYTKPVSGIPASDLSSAVQASLGKADTALQGQDVTSAVDNYLEANFSNPSNPPLDRTLTSSLSAAPADMVGEIKSAIDYTFQAPYDYVLASSFPNGGKINLSGQVEPSANYKNSDLIAVDSGAVIQGMMLVGSSILALACYDANKDFVSDASATTLSGSFTVPSGVKFVRFCYWTAYPSCWFTINNGAYKEGLKNSVDYQAIELDEINNQLYSSKEVNLALTPEIETGYKVTANGIESAASNWAVYAFVVQHGIVNLLASHRSNTQADWTFALFDADTLSGCSSSTIIGGLRYFNKNVESSFIIGEKCLLCVTTSNQTNSAKVTQKNIIYPVSDYVQDQIGNVNELETTNKNSTVDAINELHSGLYPRWHIDGTPMASANYYHVDAVSGKWMLVGHNSLVTLYDSGGTVVNNMGAVSMRGTHKPAIYCDGTWDYAEVYSSDTIPMIVQDASLFIGDSYIGLGNSRIAEQFGLQYYSSNWAKGHGGYTAKQIADMITGVPGDVDDYDSDFITAWGNGLFARAFIYVGANIISYGGGVTETLEQNTVENNIPMDVSGSIADLLDGNSITVGSTTISTVADYYALFGNTTIGQYAFLIEYLQAVHNGPIYLMGYVPWASITGRENFISTICQRLEILYGVRYLNTFVTTGYSKRNTSLITYDGIHLSSEGYQIYIQKMLKWYEHSLT